jgi:hypothetical protein
VPIRSFQPLLVLALLALDLSLVRASGADTPQAQLVDGYAVTLSFESDHIQTGANDIVVTIRDAHGNFPDATVTAAVVAYTTEGGHSDSHEQAPADAHTDDHGSASAAPEASHSDEPGATSAHGGEVAPADSHGNDHAADGHGHEAIPTVMERGSEPGIYRGVLHLEQAGTATITLTFSVDGQERAALFSVPVAQARPRALVLGAFALINGLAIVAAAVLKRRMPKKQRGAAVAPAPSIIPLTMTGSMPEEERPL